MSEFRDMALAQWAILEARLALWTRPRGELLRLSEAESVEAPSGSEDRARALALATMRAARFGLGRPRCLVRALALHRLLSRSGIRGSRIRIGVRGAGDSFQAHAWVVWGDTVLGDDLNHVSQFMIMTDGSAVTGL
jgi:hypothetical protein